MALVGRYLLALLFLSSSVITSTPKTNRRIKRVSFAAFNNLPLTKSAVYDVKLLQSVRQKLASLAKKCPSDRLDIWAKKDFPMPAYFSVKLPVVKRISSQLFSGGEDTTSSDSETTTPSPPKSPADQSLPKKLIAGDGSPLKKRENDRYLEMVVFKRTRTKSLGKGLIIYGYDRDYSAEFADPEEIEAFLTRHRSLISRLPAWREALKNPANFHNLELAVLLTQKYRMATLKSSSDEYVNIEMVPKDVANYKLPFVMNLQNVLQVRAQFLQHFHEMDGNIKGYQVNAFDSVQMKYVLVWGPLLTPYNLTLLRVNYEGSLVFFDETKYYRLFCQDSDVYLYEAIDDEEEGSFGDISLLALQPLFGGGSKDTNESWFNDYKEGLDGRKRCECSIF